MTAANLKVLVIDDEPQIRRALRAGLERYSYKVTLCQAGEEGLPADFESVYARHCQIQNNQIGIV